MSDTSHMAHALGLAARGLGTSWPNPAVGCGIVNQNRIVGRGWTQFGGRPHAETMALAQSGAGAKGATAYVTLEPCAHHGHTPPCAEALIAAGVARVVTALTDPDPRVSGRGHAMLRAAGIAVTEGVLTPQASRLNAGFLRRVTAGLPMVTLKLGLTLDGRIATASGQSRWITSPLARRATHALRMSHDAVLVGSGTARADDPDLSARDIGAAHQPIRILFDSRLSHNPDSRLGHTARQSPVWLIHTADAPATARAAWTAMGAILIEVPGTEQGLINPSMAMTLLAARGLTRILCEGGASLAASLIRENLLTDLVTFTAGAVIGSDGLAALGPLQLLDLSDAPRLTRRSTQTIGPDTQTNWSFA